jgi:hypothetical protein
MKSFVEDRREVGPGSVALQEGEIALALDLPMSHL